MANFELVDRSAIELHYLHGHDLPATTYADAAEKAIPFITEWFGAPRPKAKTADLADPKCSAL